MYEIGRTAKSVTNNLHLIEFEPSFKSTPIFMAEMQTAEGPDTAVLRWQNLDNHSVKVWIDEEQSMDSETGHIAEAIGYIAFTY